MESTISSIPNCNSIKGSKKVKTNEKEKIEKKRVKRRKTREKSLENMTLYFVNIRGMKSKLESLSQILEELKPDVVGLVETHLSGEDRINIDGYEVVRKDRKRDGGGILIAVKSKYKNVMLEVINKDDVEESLWIVLGQKTRYKIGVVYAAKGDKEKKKEIKDMYKLINEEIKQGQMKKQKMVIMGDFNCKVGIGGKDQHISKGGKILCEMMEENDLILANTVDRCEGKWTRIEGLKKSIIDYIMLEKKEKENIKKVVIDEKKEYTPFRIVKKEDKIRTVYTDHRAMICEINWVMDTGRTEGVNKVLKKMGKKCYEKYKVIISKERISRIIERNKEIKDTYTKWNKRILEIKNQCEVVIKKKKHSRTVRELIRIKRTLKIEYNKTKTEKLRKRKELITKHIHEEKTTAYAKKVKNTIEALRRNGGGMKEETFWEFRKKFIGKKEESRITMKDEKGNIKDEKEDILNIYKDFYSKLFLKENSTTTEEKEQEKRVTDKLKTILADAEHQAPLKIEEKEVKNAIKKLKRNKARDREGWNNEMILEGGEEMVKSLTAIFNEVCKQECIPDEWEKMKIKSIYKNKGSRMEMKNRRGIFLTNIVSKLYEKVIMNKTKEHIKISKYQNGGQEGRSIKDNWIAIMAVMDMNRRLKRDTHMLFADAVKCFDKLWLDDCLLDLKEAGMREKEIKVIRKLNEKARIEIETPVGSTTEIEAKKIVKQGTVFGPILCCCSTAKINAMGKRPITMVSPTMEMEPLVYVDDIGAAGSIEMIEETGHNLREMEKKKKFTFSAEKSNFMVIRTGKTEKEKPKIELKNGEIKETEEYKYLGNWICGKGTIERQVKEISGRMKGIIKEIKTLGNEEKVGKYSTEAQLMMYEKTAVPVLTYNLECWTHVRKQDWKEMEQVQGKALKSILEMPDSTPYWGILKETGIWTVQAQVNYQGFMLYQNIITSNEERLARKIVEEQKRKDDQSGWYGEINNLAKEYKINIESANKMKKQEWKKHVKEKIWIRIQEQSREKERGMTKLRHQKNQKFERQNYLKETGITEVKGIMRTRLEMHDIGNNMGKERNCIFCRKEKETWKHITQCKAVEEKMKEKIQAEWIEENITSKRLKETARWIERYIKERDKEENK